MYTPNPGTTHYHESDRGRFPSPHEVRDAPADACLRDGDEDVAFRKRRRGLDEDTDYQPPGPRRVGAHFFVSPISDRFLFQTLRRYVPRGKPSHAYSPPLVGPDLKVENSEEDLRLVSSDLDDCPEVWIGELSDYVLETQKRQKQVEKWFESSILVGSPRTSSDQYLTHPQERNIKTAQAMSRHYASKLANIPPPPPTPPLSLHEDYSSKGRVNGYEDDDDDDDDGFGGYGPVDQLDHHGSFGPDAAASKLDELFSFNSGPDVICRAPAIGLRSRTRGAMKRHAISALSDGSSDHEGSVKKDRTVATKKRRIGIPSTSDMVDDFDVPLNADHLSASAFRVLPSSARAKGKGRLVSQRELSHDSVSLTPASRRRRSAPRKRLDHLAPDRLDLLGLYHPGASASGEASPGFSRPASPATAMSFVYELDEPIPPLKRAKKIDDGAMLKRIKALEDTQRKVWVNIARRDVPKVRESHSQCALQLTFEPCLYRSTSIMPWDIKPGRRSWSG